MKKENTKLLILIGILLAIILTAVIGTLVSNSKSKKIVEQVKESINKTDNTIVYFMSKDCGYCQLYENTIEEMKYYGVDFLKVDISKLSKDQISEIAYYLQIGKLSQENIEYLDDIINSSEIDEKTKDKYLEYATSNALTDDQKNEVLDTFKTILSEDDYKTFEEVVTQIGQYGTPSLTIVGNGGVVSQYSGYHTTDNLFDYLKENDFIDEDETLPITYADLSTFKNVIDTEGKHIIVAAKSTCTYCLKYHTTLNEVARNNKDLDIIYVNMDRLYSSEDEYNAILADYPWLNIEGTPTTFIIEDNKSLDSIDGYIQSQDLETFLKTNGMMK